MRCIFGNWREPQLNEKSLIGGEFVYERSAFKGLAVATLKI
jgi:hypothetical protein